MANYSKWTAHLKGDEKKEFEERILLAAPVLKRLAELLRSKQRAQVINSSDQYDSPSWAYKQADVNGYNRAVDDVLKYLEGIE